MPEPTLRKRKEKIVFVIESDPNRQNEIREALSHQQTWKLRFFANPESCFQVLGSKPMVIFLDIEHFSSQSSDSKALHLIADLKNRSPRSEVIVFCDSEKEHEAAAALKMGALDYIVLNQHQFLRMENELAWIENVLDQRAIDRKEKIYLLLILLAMTIFILTMIVLDQMGLIKEGSNPDILIGD
jgi:DNA-binding NtrC family response regulator